MDFDHNQLADLIIKSIQHFSCETVLQIEGDSTSFSTDSVRSEESVSGEIMTYFTVKNFVIKPWFCHSYKGVTHKYKNQKKSEISDLGGGEGVRRAENFWLFLKNFLTNYKMLQIA